MKRLIIAIALLLISAPTQAENFYICSSSAGSNNGSSWDNCWAYADVFGAATDWAASKTAGKIGPGDTVYLDGGSSGVTYTDSIDLGGGYYVSFYPRVDGSSGNQITFRPGSYSSSPSGHDGLVQISSANGTGLYLSKSYITVSGKKSSASTDRNIQFTNNYQRGIGLNGTPRGIILEYLEIDTNGHSGGVNNDGITITFNSRGDTSQKVEISNCYIHDNWQDGVHGYIASDGAYGLALFHDNLLTRPSDDIMEVQGQGWRIYNNTATGPLIAGKGSGHPDGITVMNGGYAEVYSNIVYNLYDPGNVLKAGSAIYINPYAQTSADEAYGHLRVYNNLCYFTGEVQSEDYPNGIVLSWQTDGTNNFAKITDILVANNTVVGFNNNALQLFPPSAGIESTFIVNNVFHNNARYNSSTVSILMGSTSFTLGSWGDSVDVVFDYNVVSAGDSGHNGCKKAATSYIYADFKSTFGVNDNASNETNDPNLTALYKPQASSTNIITGRDLSSYFTTDKDGSTTRSNWTIGAYEYVAPTKYIPFWK